MRLSAAKHSRPYVSTVLQLQQAGASLALRSGLVGLNASHTCQHTPTHVIAPICGCSTSHASIHPGQSLGKCCNGIAVVPQSAASCVCPSPLAQAQSRKHTAWHKAPGPLHPAGLSPLTAMQQVREMTCAAMCCVFMASCAGKQQALVEMTLQHATMQAGCARKHGMRRVSCTLIVTALHNWQHSNAILPQQNWATSTATPAHNSKVNMTKSHPRRKEAKCKSNFYQKPPTAAAR